jgi:hypothetical protein
VRLLSSTRGGGGETFNKPRKGRFSKVPLYGIN